MTATGLSEKQKATIIRNRYTTLRENQVDIFDDVQVYYQMYQAFMDEDDSYPWDYQLTDPVVFQLLRNLMARLNPADYKVRLEATTEQADPFRDANQAYINWELSEMSKTLVFYNMLWRGLLAGRSYIYTGWLYEPAVEIKDKQNKTKKVMRDLVNRAYACNVRFVDMFVPNRNVPEIQEQPYLIQRLSKRFGELLDDNKAAEDKGEDPVWKEDYLKKIRESKKFSTKVDYGVDLPIDDTDEEAGKSEDDIFIRGQYVNMLRFQTIDGDVLYVPEEESTGEWVMNENTESEYWHNHYPYITFAPFPEDDEFFSQGIVQPVADLQVALSSVLNQFLTNGRLASNPMWVAGKEAKETPDHSFVNRPNGVIRVAGDANAVQQMPVRDVSNTYISMRQDLMTTFERATSMSSLYSSGVSGGSSPQVNKTATGARVIDANMDQNLQLLVSIFGSMSLSQLGKHFLELNAQYLTEDQKFKITGEKTFRTLKPTEVSTSYNALVNPDTVLKSNPVVKQAQLMNFIGTANAEKKVPLDTKPAWETLINTYPELDEGGEHIIIDPEYQAEQAINSIEEGIMPAVTASMDHKLIIQIVQKHVLDTQPEGEVLKAYAEYLDEHRKWIEAADMNMVSMQPQPDPMNPATMLPNGGLPPAVPGAAPTGVDMNGDMTGNPTANLPMEVPMDEMGIPGGGL